MFLQVYFLSSLVNVQGEEGAREHVVGGSRDQDEGTCRTEADVGHGGPSASAATSSAGAEVMGPSASASAGAAARNAAEDVARRRAERAASEAWLREPSGVAVGPSSADEAGWRTAAAKRTAASEAADARLDEVAAKSAGTAASGAASSAAVGPAASR